MKKLVASFLISKKAHPRIIWVIAGNVVGA